MDNYVEADDATNSLSTHNSNKTYHEIAKKLLEDKFLLTALELHAELCESGKEIPVLRDFFSNANNFETHNIKPEPSFVSMPRSSSQVTLDSLDMTRYSEDDGIDERVAILEFELRKARDNITALRENLTVVAESDSVTPTDKINDRNETPIKPHEKKAINFLIYEYLLARLYKLTSITFSDENENQDFENWDDVGLNTPKPPDLLQIYREFLRGNGCEKPPSHEIGIQTDFNENDLPSSDLEENSNKYLIDELESLKNQVLSLEQTRLNLENRLENVGTLKTAQITKVMEQRNQPISSNSTTPDKFEILETPEDDNLSLIASVGDTDPGDKDWTKVQLLHRDVTIEMPTLLNSPSRSLPFKFKCEVLSHCLTTSQMVDGLHDSLINSVTLSLQKIIPNIVPNKRDESIPLILNTLRFTERPSEREKLLQLLFNLKKKPQEEDRRLLLGGLIGIVKNQDTPPFPEEIMTVCWEQSQHKYPERRILAAECCTNLAPFTSSDIRNSLMLSMLQQMLLDDKDPSVKSTVIKSLSLLVALMDDTEKYFQCEELALTALDDNNTEVFEPTSNLLFPILAQWALSLNRFESHLLPRILTKLKRQLVPAQSKKNYHRDNEKIFFTITVLQFLLPHTIIFVVNNPIVKSKIQESTSSEIPKNIMSLCRSSITNPQIFFNEDENIGILLNTFFNTSWNDEPLKTFDWLSDKLIPDILEMIKSIDIHQENILNPMLNYVQNLCTGFDKFVTQEIIKQKFSIEIEELQNELMNLSSDKVPSINLTLIPAYLTVLSTIDSLEMSKTLKHFIVLLSISNCDSSCLIITVKRLVKNSQITESVLTVLWDSVVHQRPIVRTTAAKLFCEIIQIVNERLVTSRIAPAIVTLASDADLMVKSEAIYGLGKLITECDAREAKDKGRLTLESIVKEPQGIPSVLLIPIVTTLAKIAPSCPQHFVEDAIVTQLVVICNKIDGLQQNRRFDLTVALLDAFSILVYCSLSDKCVVDVLLPGLRFLENFVCQLVPQKKEIIKSLIREIESRQNNIKTIERSTSASSGLSLSLATANVGQGVEDMRQRMSKIFNQRKK